MSKMTADLKWEGDVLTLGDLREIVDRTHSEPDDAIVHPTVTHGQRDGDIITLRVTLLNANLLEGMVQA